MENQEKIKERNYTKKNGKAGDIMVKFGVDVGGTTIKTGLFEDNGRLIEKYEIPTDKTEQGRHIIDNITEHLRIVLKEKGMEISQCRGVGIGLPGPVDSEGNILGCVNLGWGTFNIEQEFSKKFGGLPVKAGNDATVATLGEQRAGAGRGMKNLMMITLGTGVGGGIINQGEIVYGTNGAAGEIGHMPVNLEETDMCNCGKRGCLEQYASATGVVRMAKKLMDISLENDFEKGSDKYFHTVLNRECTAKQVFDAAKAGDALAKETVESLGRYLGMALATAACILNPECIVIGGGVSRAGEILIREVEKNFNELVFGPCRNVKFMLAELGNDAGIYGAAALIN